MTGKRKDSRPIWLIRDAEGLSTSEKVYLYTVATHANSVMSRTAEENYTAMGISKATYYRTRDALLAKGLLVARRRYNSGTAYALDWDALRALVAHDYAQQPDEQPKTRKPSEFHKWADARLEALNKKLAEGGSNWTDTMRLPVEDRTEFRRLIRRIWDNFENPEHATEAWAEAIEPKLVVLAVSADRINALKSILEMTGPADW